ncbi:MAG: NADH-quinone oxidoreductase subunit C [Deltaproteobacteria bacterium]|nr:NADH-quinone oxidoreductase subunit C [Deltaproteobacteria bacterium]
MMKRDLILQKLRKLLPEGAVSEDEGYESGVAFSARVPVARIVEIASACDHAGAYLESMTGLDFEDTAEIVYHFHTYEPKSRFSLRVLFPHEEKIPTLSGIFSSAVWLEREVREFFGYVFADHPDPRNLLLPEDADFHPLRKTFGKIAAYRKREEIYA